MTWYASLSDERRAEVIASASASVTRRRAEARARGKCLCGRPLRVIFAAGKVRTGSRCVRCDADRRLKRRAWRHGI